MSLVDPPSSTKGCGWYFLGHPDRSRDGSNLDQIRLIAFEELRAQINNGGLDQLFLNGSTNMLADAIDFLIEVGHAALIEIITQAQYKFPGPFPVDRGLRHEQLLELEEDWDRDLTDRYYEIEKSESLDALTDRFVEARWASFFTS